MKTKTVPIPRQSLTSAVAERLREKIVRGELQDGEQLRQDRLAFEFEVSRIPVREALRQLEAEGLIKIVAHRGAVVSALAPDEIEELFDIRALLESEVLRLSIPRLTESDLEKAANVLALFEKSVQQDDDARHWDRLNAQFHSALYSRANRPQFSSLIRMINNNGERYSRLQAYVQRGFQRATEEHRLLLDLCRKKDVSAACNLLHSHIRRAGQSLKEFVSVQRERARELAEREHAQPHSHSHTATAE
jgi:DNA-binding GntR family transcriptional regulator